MIAQSNRFVAWIAAGVLLCGAAVQGRADTTFDAWMHAFEQAKRQYDYPVCEMDLLQALKYGLSEYAYGSLVWAQMNQNKTDIALKNALRMYQIYGATPYSVGSVIDASLREGDFQTMNGAVDLAKRLDLANGSDWTNRMVRDLIEKVHRLTTPAVYHLKWTIPGSAFTSERPARKFGFPLLTTKRQHFEYTLTGALSSQVLEANEKHTVVAITGKPGQDVVV